MKRALVLIAVSALISTSAQAGQQSAERFFRAGAKAYEAGQYDIACRALEQAYELTPLPAIAFSLAQAYRLRYFADPNPDHLRRAKELYEAYLEKTPSGGRRHDSVTALAEIEPMLAHLDPKRSTVEVVTKPTQLMVTSQLDEAVVSIDGGPPFATPATVEVTPGPHDLLVSAEGYFDVSKKAIAVDGRLIVEEVELRPKPAQVEVKSDPKARVFVDGRAAGATPLAAPLQVPAGPHAFTIVANGRKRWEQRLELARGDRTSLEAELETTGQRIAAWTFVGSAGVTAILGGLAALGAGGANRDARHLNEKRELGGLTSAELADYDALLADRRTFRGAAIGLLSTTAVLGLTGLLLYLFDEPDFTPVSF